MEGQKRRKSVGWDSQNLPLHFGETRSRAASTTASEPESDPPREPGAPCRSLRMGVYGQRHLCHRGLVGLVEFMLRGVLS